MRDGGASLDEEQQVSWREQYNRLNKALTIADYLQAASISSRDAQMGGDAEWKMAAQLAGFSDYTPREATRTVVIRLLTNREKAAAKISQSQEGKA